MDDQKKSGFPTPGPEGDGLSKRCPRCGRRYPEDVSVCPEDGTPLSARREGGVETPSPGKAASGYRSATLVVGADQKPMPEPPPVGPAPSGEIRPEPPAAEPDSPVPPNEASDPGGGDPLVGQLLRNKWKVLERVGSGAFGTVYKVQDVKGGWIEALKILSVDRLVGMDAEHARKRFLREAQLVKRLGKESAHIVGLSTYEEDLEAGLIYFLMDFVEGRSLGELVRFEGPFPEERAVGIALQVCDALMVAHEGPEPVVHRDLKLENIMLARGRGGEEVAKVLDFGIAKIAEREQDSRLTEAGTSLGTPGFAAPEQVRAAPVDARTDLFAFGAILYNILTGRDPWLGEPAGLPSGKIYELMVASERADVRPISETGVAVSADLAEIVLKLLRRDPEERFSSARELKAALESVGAVTPSRETGIRLKAPGPRVASARRRTGVIAGATGIVLLLLLLLVIRPWGRTLDLPGIQAQAERGTIVRARLTASGIQGYGSVLGFLPAPFRVAVSEEELVAAVERLTAAGVDVDASWWVGRLLERAVQAQAEMRYFGFDGEDVRGYAERMMALDPENPEARSLLLKVGERMAWDAEAAFAEGSEGVARDLLRQCREIVPGHPRCEAVASRG